MKALAAFGFVFVISTVLVACASVNRALDVPPDTSTPAWAQKDCGVSPTMCPETPPSCCPAGFACCGAPPMMPCGQDECEDVGNTDGFGAKRHVKKHYAPTACSGTQGPISMGVDLSECGWHREGPDRWSCADAKQTITAP